MTHADSYISTNRQRKSQARPNMKLRKRSIVVMTRDTKVALEERILRTMKKLSKENDQDYSETFTDWETPKITWINGVPGCGKTTWIVQEFDNKRDCIVTATIEAAEDLKRKLANRIGAEATTRVRTMASVLVNGFKEHTHNRLLIDEAMMNHFGAIITAALLAKAKELLLIGDINQIPHIDRHNVFPMSYEKPNAVAKVSRELLRSYRNPMDVAYALNEIYSGIYSTQEGTRSLTMDGYDINKLSISLPQTLYLAHTQAGKTELKAMGCGQGKESRVLTIHEAQGLASKNVVIVRTASKKAEIYNSIQHAVVAITRHTENCIYLTVNCSDAIGRLIQRANNATSERIIEYNAKMAIRSRDINSVREITKHRRKPEHEESDTSRRALAAATVRHFTALCDNKSPEQRRKIDAEGSTKTYQVRSAVETSCKSVFAREEGSYDALDPRPATSSEAKAGAIRRLSPRTTGNPDFTRKWRKPDGERRKVTQRATRPGTKSRQESRWPQEWTALKRRSGRKRRRGFRRSGSRRGVAGRQASSTRSPYLVGLKEP
ncbi:hypothetical protein EVAR_23345_1 [Eumeta japonica]|uniref:(+)RNA virus helicase C-terminal domain-containing protein n=1 Tax=Eumeta variegata TaxID=151549 RepID=A0A4C1XZQ7_EUMVA|nr:hypothetical protein EVAR_23345_1 [Eumeta japonica]